MLTESERRDSPAVVTVTYSLFQVPNSTGFLFQVRVSDRDPACSRGWGLPSRVAVFSDADGPGQGTVDVVGMVHRGTAIGCSESELDLDHWIISPTVPLAGSVLSARNGPWATVVRAALPRY